MKTVTNATIPLSQSLYTTEGSNPTASRPCWVRDECAASTTRADRASLSQAGVSRASSQMNTSLSPETAPRGTTEACTPVLAADQELHIKGKHIWSNNTHTTTTPSTWPLARKKKTEYLLSRVRDADMSGGTSSPPVQSARVGGLGLFPVTTSDKRTCLADRTLLVDRNRLVRCFDNS